MRRDGPTRLAAAQNKLSTGCLAPHYHRRVKSDASRLYSPKHRTTMCSTCSQRLNTLTSLVQIPCASRPLFTVPIRPLFKFSPVNSLHQHTIIHQCKQSSSSSPGNWLLAEGALSPLSSTSSDSPTPLVFLPRLLPALLLHAHVLVQAYLEHECKDGKHETRGKEQLLSKKPRNDIYAQPQAK